MSIRKGVFQSLPINISNALLSMSRSFRPIKAVSDTRRLKEQRDAKRIKEELALKLQADKASEVHVEVLFLHKLYEDGKNWRRASQVEQGFAKLTILTSKRNSLK